MKKKILFKKVLRKLSKPEETLLKRHLPFKRLFCFNLTSYLVRVLKFPFRLDESLILPEKEAF